MSFKNVLCLIPARSGSKTIKNKNIVKINNKELFYYSIRFSKKLKFIKKIIFSSDSSNYLSLAKKFGLNDLHKRKKKLSGDNSLTEDLVREILFIEKKKNFNYDFVLILQPTTPFRQKKMFDLAHKILLKKKFDTVITIKDVKDHPERMKKILYTNQVVNYLNMKKESLKPRQKLKNIYIRSGAMYFFRSDNLKKYNSIVGKKVYGIITNGKYSINIDDQEDLILAKYYAKK